MMPFSVLRIFGLGLLSWTLLGLGIWLAYESYDQFRRADQRANRPAAGDEKLDIRGEDDALPQAEPPESNVTTQRAWTYAALATALLAWSLLGFLPARFLLGGSGSDQAQPIRPSKDLWVDRPDGARLRVEVFGDDSRPTILLSHGWSVDASGWDYVKAKLAERYRVVVWDLPGLGQSRGPKNRDFSLERMAGDLDAVIRATATREPLILASHSFSGFATQVFCRLYPQHLGQTVQGIALIHTTYTNPLRTCALASLATALEAPLITPLNYLMIPLAPLAWLSNWQSYLNGSLHTTTRIASFTGKQSRQQLDHGALLAAKAWPAVIARGNLAMQKFNEERTLPRIDVPVLVLGSQHDRMTLPSASEHIERLLPHDRPHRLDSGHLSFMEVADDFVAIFSEFVDSVSASGKPEPEMGEQPAKAV
jgi:pimeloyl-ACP methyl ester carboxylesterase